MQSDSEYQALPKSTTIDHLYLTFDALIIILCAYQLLDIFQFIVDGMNQGSHNYSNKCPILLAGSLQEPKK